MVRRLAMAAIMAYVRRIGRFAAAACANGISQWASSTITLTRRSRLPQPARRGGVMRVVFHGLVLALWTALLCAVLIASM